MASYTGQKIHHANSSALDTPFFRQLGPVIKAQTVIDSSGWWDATTLGIPETRETTGMTEQDARIYVTAMIVISTPPWRSLPIYHPTKDSEPASTNAQEDIIIKF